ncbi:GNAT family N-acetyltransferase [Verrucosispora sp. NA02020]|uniref:GNAT family N-acetyltransferase n=1 Tax=Verrucosispora sp. NA02020 TaxID=2742132 RepID=UPI001590444A|nr:GNAT family N-acetyltransferase [Verrucosispora sp. NA02020]QKW13215.1 GNAT family N-acetyltransferase [Verrucosispora sp. NA02020]
MTDLGLHELRLMQGLAQQVMELRPELVNGEATVGELAWGWAKDHDALHRYWRHRLWFVDDRLAAWGWAYLPHRVARSDGTFREVTRANLIWQAHPDRPELLAEVLDWYDEVAGDVDRALTVQVGDAASRAAVVAHGYVFDAETASDTGSWVQFNARELVDVPEPVLPEGFRLRTAEHLSAVALARAHWDAWPRSSFTDTACARVQRTWPYRADLHVLVEAPEGTLAATAIVWLDEATRTAEFEPVGTHRDFRRRGLGTALQLYGMQLARAAGARRMLVACLGAPGHPAARGLYLGVGFREFTRDLPHLKLARGR